MSSVKYMRNQTTFHSKLADIDDDGIATNFDNKMANLMMEEEFDTIELSEHGNKHNSSINNLYQPKSTPKSSSIFKNMLPSRSNNQKVDDDNEDVINIKLFGRHQLVHQQDIVELTEDDGHVMRPVFYVSNSSPPADSPRFAAICNILYITARFLSCNFCSPCRPKNAFERLDD